MDKTRQPTVLVVDDEPDSRLLLAELIRGDCRVLLARDGPMALDILAQAPDVELILLDLTMPGPSGLEVLERLRGNERTAHIPVVVITGRTTEEIEERALKAGASDFLHKPIRASTARVRIDNQLRLVAQRRELEELSERDGLTGISNRRYFDKMFALALRHCARTAEPFALGMIDIDHFKQYNDHYGHAPGDEALRRVARALAAEAGRPYDVVARFGGEEFVLLLPGATEVAPTLERMRTAVANLRIAHEALGPEGIITISCGGIVVSGPIGVEDASRLIDNADQKLYAAKHLGRNRIQVGRI